ncbi:hypothetical protein cypCar_00041884 [Cyprinus carpio]|nr:hypothetical protein cypCar_00041884 [Cyprinus carpio]
MERLQMLSQQIGKYLLLFLLTASGVICQDWIRPMDQRTSVSSTEGESVTLECSYDTSSSYVFLYWYRQFSNTQPEYILRKGGRSETYEDIPDPKRFGTTTSQKSTSLTIKSVTLSDSALYYCALRVTAQCYKVPERLYKNSLRKFALNSELSNEYQTKFVSS